MGNTLSGDQTIRPSIVFHKPLLADFDRVCEAEGVSRSAKLRELAREYVERHGDGTGPDQVPSEAELARAYRDLLDVAEGRADSELRVPLEQAQGALYTNEIPKDAVKGRLLSPLKRRGYVDVVPALSEVWVYVRPPR